MNRYITNIHVNRVYHLHDFDIPIPDDAAPHLILTGKNGSGKTSLLQAMSDYLDAMMRDGSSSNEKVAVELSDEGLVRSNTQRGDFIITFYEANRKVEMYEPRSPRKPAMRDRWNVRETASDEFLNFLADLEIQAALAQNNGKTADAEEIDRWFDDFAGLLRQIFQDDALRLNFNYKDYSFHIETEGKSFKFTEMSDGFAAVLDIVVDLILKMQRKDSLTRAYEKQGIVLIDEVETHLHLELQKVILPMLTKIFPRIQFIVTTHSPFVLNSLDNAVAFDLEHQELITDLTQYSYEALAEGYFGVRTDSSYMEMQLARLKDLLGKESLTSAEEKEARSLIKDFEEIPEPVSPTIVGQYLELKLQFIDKISDLKSNDPSI
jgi:predicted ATP-binding protein involved in virulence